MAIVLVVEDGTGLETANVYDLAAAAELWLVDRGYAVFAAGTDAEKDRWLLEATEEMERQTTNRVEGALINRDQGLLHPRRGSIDARYISYDSDERPADYREGIFLLSEDVAVAAGAGARISEDRRDYVSAESDNESGSTSYRRGQSFNEAHPAAMERALGAFPAGLRSRRA